MYKLKTIAWILDLVEGVRQLRDRDSGFLFIGHPLLGGNSIRLEEL